MENWINIVYQDKNYLLCRKPHGLASTWGQEKSFLDLIKNLNSDSEIWNDHKTVFGEQNEYGLLNRLDTPTAWFLYFARTLEAKERYVQLQKEDAITKIYYAKVYGTPSGQFGWIDRKVWHHGGDQSRMTVEENKGRGQGQQGITYREKIERENTTRDEFCRLKIHITTGIRHQIRVHLASMGHPLVGDGLYMTQGLRKRYGKYENAQTIELISAGIIMNTK